MTNRRRFLAALAATMQLKAAQLPANRNVKWALSLGLWNHFQPVPFTEVLDMMKDTGFIGIRLTGYPGCLKTYNLTAAQMEKEVSKRNLNVVTISFGGPANDPDRHGAIMQGAREAMQFLKGFGASHLVVFPPSRLKAGADVEAGFKAMCDCYNHLGQ